MKAKLIKTFEGYELHILNNKNNLYMPSAYIPKRASCRVYYLSKQNCDSIFGIIDVELMADFYGAKAKGSVDFKFGANKGFEDGFNKAMELDKDKLFTLEDMRNAMDWIMIQYFEFNEQPTGGRRERYLESLQQPTEIEVEIVMETKQQLVNGYKNQPENVIGFVVEYENILAPKLDSEGCLILKKL